jgi:spermidine synthase
MGSRLVFLTVFVIAACGLGYELVAGTLASYLLGDSVTQFSTAIGLYLFAMGIGSYLSRFIERRIVDRFVELELAVALVGGTLAAVLFLTFGGKWFRPVLYGEILTVGTLVGLEIPLLLRILKDQIEFKELVSQVLTFDYIGALFVSLLFPLWLVPKLGLARGALLLGIANALVALWSTWIFRERIARAAGLRARCGAVLVILTAGFALAEPLTRFTEASMYADDVVLTRSTPYQRIVVTKNAAGFQLFLNGALQFSSADEYRYHEALVHPAFAVNPEARRVLVLGGGDGLALREALRHRRVERAVLVDIDPEMTELAKSFGPLAELNRAALSDPRVQVVNEDAMLWLEGRPGLFDVVIADFPDPTSFSVGKLYTSRFYEKAAACLAPDGVLAVQATSPLFARSAYWCIARTIEACGFEVKPYHAFVPSFGEWGFVLASRRRFEAPAGFTPGSAPEGLRYLDGPTMSSLFQLPVDLGPLPVEVNRLNNQILVHYYETEWRKWN